MQLKEFNPEEIIVHPELRTRKVAPAPEDVQRIAESIATDGQLQAGLVRVGDDGKVHLVAGEHRLEAIRLLNSQMGKDEKPLKFYATVTKGNEGVAIARSGLENEIRKATDIFDRGVLITRLIEIGGMKQSEIALRFGWSEGLVSRTLKAAKLPPKIMKMVQNGDLEEDAALELLESDKFDKVQADEVMAEAIRHRNAYEEIKKRKAAEAEAKAKADAAAAELEKDPEKKKAAAEKAKKSAKKAGESKRAAAKQSKVSKEDVQQAKSKKGLGEPTPMSRKAFFVLMEAVGKNKEKPIPASAKALLGKIEEIMDGETKNPEQVLYNTLTRNCIPD